MKIVLTEEQEMLRASARDFLEKECTEGLIKSVEASGLGWAPDLWEKIAGLGWLGLIFPQELGGSAMGFVDAAVLCEELGRAMFPGPYVSTVAYGGITILEAGSEEQKSRVLPRVIEGREIICLVLNEPSSARTGGVKSADGVTVRGEPAGDGFVLNGEALFVHDANIAGTLLVPAVTKPGGNPEAGVTLFAVEATAPGINITRLASIAGDNPCEVVLDNVRVPAGALVGNLHRGWAPLARSLEVGAVMLSAQMLGAGERLFQIATEDYETRISANKSVEDRTTQQYLSQLRRDLDSCRLATYRAAARLAAGEPCDFETAVVRSWSDYARTGN